MRQYLISLYGPRNNSGQLQLGLLPDHNVMPTDIYRYRLWAPPIILVNYSIGFLPDHNVMLTDIYRYRFVTKTAHPIELQKHSNYFKSIHSKPT